MPTYQYACTVCEHGFEVVQSFTDDALTECPQCQGRLRKVFGSVGVVFKGSGFYRNDSRANANGGDTAESKGGDKGADKADKTDKAGKPDSKPAAKDSSGSAGSSSSSGSTGSTGSTGGGKATASSTAGSAA